jgi:hypothetical protein
MRDLASRGFKRDRRNTINGQLRIVRYGFVGDARAQKLGVRERHGRSKGSDKAIVERVAALMSAAHGRVLGNAAHRLRMGSVHGAHNRTSAFRRIAEDSPRHQGERRREKRKYYEDRGETRH